MTRRILRGLALAGLLAGLAAAAGTARYFRRPAAVEVETYAGGVLTGRRTYPASHWSRADTAALAEGIECDGCDTVRVRYRGFAGSSTTTVHRAVFGPGRDNAPVHVHGPD